MDINQVANFLQISSATVRNWIKHSYLAPIDTTGKTRFFYQDVRSFKEDLINGRINRLRKRANKNRSTSTSLPIEYLSDPQKVHDINTAAKLIVEHNVSADEGLFFLTLNFLSQEGLVVKTARIDDLLAFKNRFFCHHQIMQEMRDWAKKILFKSNHDFQLKILATHVPQVQDFLGVVYQSLSAEGKKSQSGAYYTPRQIAEGIIGDHLRAPHLKVLDPCCGTGQFLLVALDRLISMSGEKNAIQNVWGQDVDAIAVQIARINVIAKCKTQDDVSPHIYCGNTLFENAIDLFAPKPCLEENFFYLVFTNPPWGAKFSSTELSQLSRLFPQIASRESFSYFIEKGLEYLKENGILSYILPESFLNVRIHEDIRKKILNNTSVIKTASLNRAFKNVFTPAIRLDIQKKSPPDSHRIEIENGKTFQVEQKTFLVNRGGEFHINVNQDDSIILDKIYSQNHSTLTGKADWALGVVTGDNARFLSSTKLPGYEPVLTGKEISKFTYHPAKHFIRFESKELQQAAPEHKYRVKEKLIYRFISKELVFSYDNQQQITLNSANILIPKTDQYPVKFILGLFNSSLYQYIFRKKFNSIKVLRSHIEALPLPHWPEQETNQITGLADTILDCGINQSRRNHFLHKLDELVMLQWGLTKEDMNLVSRSLNLKEKD